jgi:hypothetical protein
VAGRELGIVASLSPGKAVIGRLRGGWLTGGGVVTFGVGYAGNGDFKVGAPAGPADVLLFDRSQRCLKNDASQNLVGRALGVQL